MRNYSIESLEKEFSENFNSRKCPKRSKMTFKSHFEKRQIFAKEAKSLRAVAIFHRFV